MGPVFAPPIFLYTIMLPLISILILASTAHPDSGNVSDAMLDEAVTTYGLAMETIDIQSRLERFRHAGRLFAQVIESRGIHNPSLYVNRANAALQGNDLGNAVLGYRRALHLEPGHEQARKNLEYARSMLPDWVPRPTTTSLFDTFFFWYQRMSPPGRQLATAIGFACAAIPGALALRYRRRGIITLAGIIAIAWCILAMATVWSHRPGQIEEVVVIAPRTIARSADSSGAPPRFREPLPAGTEASLIMKRDDWVHIRLANGRDSWVREKAVAPVQIP